MKDKKQQLLIIFIIFAITLIFFQRVLEHLYFGNESKKTVLHNAVNKSLEREKYLNNFLQYSTDNLKALRDMEMFESYIKGSYPKDDLEKIFITFSKAHSNFMQLRYLDKDGFEKIRIDRDKENGRVYPIEEKRLQNKENRYYFKDSRSKELEKVWFSAIDLNIERGELEIPYKPTLRAILPVKHEGEFNGIIIINYFMENFLKDFLNTPLYNIILCNEKGYILKHYNKEKEWSFYNRGKSYTIQDEFPAEYGKILSSPLFQTKDFVSRKLDVKVHDGLYLILKADKKYIQQERYNTFIKHLTNSMIVIIFSIVLSMIILRKYSRTLLNLDEIKKINDKLTTASKIAKIGFCEIDRLTHDINWSNELYEIFEIEDKKAKITYERFFSFVEEEYKTKLKHLVASSIHKHNKYFITFKIRTAKGNIKYLEMRGKHYFDSNGKLLRSLSSIYDITELYQLKNHLEEKVKKQLDINLHQEILLFEQSKMAAMGSMIGNIAHQWKQPLSTISTIASGIQTNYDYNIEISREDMVDFMEQILNRVDYLSNNISTFKNFLKENKEYKTVILQNEINKALDICLLMLTDNGIELKNDIDYEHNIQMKLVSGELPEVIINIINNAKDALKEKFTENPWIKTAVLEEKGKVIITIEDNGGGISKDIMPHIFDEYFTTKDEEKGTGLGLHMSKLIIQNSLNGKIYAQNTQYGAKFFIELPAEE